jgi:hypothetical protein
MRTSLDPYAVLGLRPDASEADIKRAYRALARRHHPDYNPGDPAAEAKFKEIAAAYELLGDVDRRKQHHEAQGRTRAPETFLADFTDALERAERLVFVELVPRYSGGPAERVARLARDAATKAVNDRMTGRRPGLFARWRASRDLGRISVQVDYRSAPPSGIEAWKQAWGGYVIVFYPESYWARGIREPAALDDAVFQALLVQLIAVLRTERRVNLVGIDSQFWEETVQGARNQDLEAALRIWGKRGFWGVVALFSAALLYAGWSARK